MIELRPSTLFQVEVTREIPNSIVQQQVWSLT